MGILTPLQGMLFDFDGLIVDTETAIYQAWKEIYRDYGQEMDLSEWARYVGKSVQESDPIGELLKSLGGKMDGNAIREEIASREHKFVSKTGIMPGVKRLLKQAQKQGLRMGIVSSSGQEWIERHLRRLELEEYFDNISSSDEVERAKPDPALYQLGLSKLGVEADRVIVLEDSPNGVLAAKRAGLYCIAIPNRVTRQMVYHTNGGKPDRVIKSLEEFSLDEYLG